MMGGASIKEKLSDDDDSDGEEEQTSRDEPFGTCVGCGAHVRAKIQKWCEYCVTCDPERDDGG